MEKKRIEKKDKEIVLEIIGFENYFCELPSDEMLDYLDLSRDDVLQAEVTMIDMPGYFYKEDIACLGNVIVGGGSLEVTLATNKGIFRLQPFLRYDKGHKVGLKQEHFNPKLRIIYPNEKVKILPEPGTKYNIFGEKMGEIITIKTDIHLWKAYGPESGKKFEGKIRKKTKRKPQTAKRILKRT